MWAIRLGVALGIGAGLSFGTAQFATAENLVTQAMPLVITSIRQMLVVLVGGLDLSAGSVISFTNAILTLNAPAWVLIPAVFVLAAAIGFVVTRFRAHSIIVTLSTHYVVPGAASDLWRDGARGGDRRRFGQPVGHALCRALG